MTAVAARLHADEVPSDEQLVQRLVSAQFPQWAGRPVRRHETTGSDHVQYRLGDDLVVRMPRKAGVDRQVDKERFWLPRLAPSLSAAIPEPVAKGAPGEGFPFSWSVYRWLEADDAPAEGVDDATLAHELARFAVELRRIDPAGGPAPSPSNFGRGEPLAIRDEPTRFAIRELAGEIDTRAVTAAWEAALRAPLWTAEPVWVHGDLAPENILLREGRLAAVIDWGCLGVGDPAVDVMAAWAILCGDARDVFRRAAEVDDDTWARGRGWALSTALIALPYYGETHPPRAANARFRIREVLADG
jgi:aminoglycoside phosphotransferase (APT) family kinase protein